MNSVYLIKTQIVILLKRTNISQYNHILQICIYQSQYWELFFSTLMYVTELHLHLISIIVDILEISHWSQIIHFQINNICVPNSYTLLHTNFFLNSDSKMFQYINIHIHYMTVFSL